MSDEAAKKLTEAINDLAGSVGGLYNKLNDVVTELHNHQEGITDGIGAEIGDLRVAVEELSKTIGDKEVSH